MSLAGACKLTPRQEHLSPPDRHVVGGAGTSSGDVGGSGGSAASGGTSGAGGSSSAGNAGSGSAGEAGATVGGSGGSGGEAQDAGQGGSDSGTPFTKRGLLESIAACTFEKYRQFETQADELVRRADAWAETPDAAQRKLAQRAWRTAIQAWQQAEVFRIGPAGRKPEPGARELRDHIYSWPLVNRCGIDETTVDQTYAQADFPSISLINVRTLTAFEYLAFYGGSDNACGSFSAINANGTWAALGSDDLAARKAGYAKSIATAVASRAHELVTLWDPQARAFYTEFVEAAGASATYSSEQQALNAASDALFYIEKEFKDQKLGLPLGLVPGCSQTSCPEYLESQYADASLAHLEANLRGFRDLFLGCASGSGLGFDDWLIAVGADALATSMTEALDRASVAVAELGPSLAQVLANDTPRVRAAHATVRELTVLLKTEFVSVLNLELPKGTEGDND